MDNAERIKQKALDLGFDLAGISSAEPLSPEEAEIFRKWLNFGYAGQMQFFKRNLDKRINPAELLVNAKSIIVVGLNYKPGETTLKPTGAGRVSRYAQFEDYHTFMKKLLKRLADFIVSDIDADSRFKICVDSVPLAERAFAVRAGLGFIGKNHLLINPALGVEIFLGELITTIDLECDEPLEKQCNGCDKCLRMCPTGALRKDGWFDARKCISYLTVEHKGRIDNELTGKMDNWLFGCDECVLACPYQKKAPACANKSFKYHPDRAAIELDKIINMSGEEFAREFAGSPIHRTGLNAMKRNARICVENNQGQEP